MQQQCKQEMNRLIVKHVSELNNDIVTISNLISKGINQKSQCAIGEIKDNSVMRKVTKRKGAPMQQCVVKKKEVPTAHEH